ncbi:hypothetical protein NNC19_02720 [Clostridium sp. SHJSY1]|uniref:hypothetical protein n=1 Tax=Clostridium sp. SHJSY1 TaxID=2942483 RepID=UPI00287611F8|nr:hypothetical protein [Clostridium sp. SHJSY1]MDS0524575.1 hypothetical protein [Clostridium sp. SHJSY1]
MKFIKENSMLKLITFGLIWSVGACILAIVISAITLLNFKDVIFIEGLVLFGIGLLSSINEEELCGSLKGTGGFNYQYISGELQAREKENKIIVLNSSSINMDMIIGGIISILMLIL